MNYDLGNASNSAHHGYYLRSCKNQNTQLIEDKKEEILNIINCEICGKEYEVTKSEKNWKTLCTGCWYQSNVINNSEHGYYLRTEDRWVFKNCSECNRPFEVKESEKEWKSKCMSCWLKFNGKTTNCRFCHTQLQVFEPSSKDMCYNCYLRKAGAKRKCTLCGNNFYIDSKCSINKKLCYDCFLVTNGIKRKCIDCKEEHFVLKENLKWKKKCVKCYYKS
jgi:hypothetical protein